VWLPTCGFSPVDGAVVDGVEGEVMMRMRTIGHCFQNEVCVFVTDRVSGE